MSPGLLACWRNPTRYGITTALILEVSHTPVYLDGRTQTFIFIFIEKHAIWDFSPANPEKYVSLGSYFQYSHGGKPEAPPSTKDEYIKNLRAVRKDLLVEATLTERPVSSP
jgi:hypothetical protein